MAQKTQAQITAEITQYIIDNTQGAIMPAQVRTILYDLNDSLMNTAGNQIANVVFAGPAAGGPAAPSFRALVGADLPDPSLTAKGGVKAIAAITSRFITSISLLGQPVLGTVSSTDIADSTTVGRAVLTAANAAAARSAIGSTAVGDALFIAASAAAARATLGSTSVGDAVFIAASKSAGLTALGLKDGSGGDVTMTSQNSGALAGFRNRLMNGNFALNQRVYVTTTATAVGTYMHDRWKSNTAASAYSFTQGSPDTSITVTAGTIVQIIEGANIEGGTYVLSWAGSATLRWAQGASPAAALAALGGAFAASPIAITGVTAGNYIAVESSTGTLGLVQFELGTVATTFERVDFGTELGRCLRYYEKSFSSNTAPAQNVGSVTNAFTAPQVVAASTALANVGFIKFCVRKFTAATITIFNPLAANAQIRNVTKSTDFTVSTIINAGALGFGVSGTSPAGSVAGDQISIHWTAEAEL